MSKFVIVVICSSSKIDWFWDNRRLG